MHAVSHCYCRYRFIIALSPCCHYVLPMNDSPANVRSLSHSSVVQQWHARLVSSLMSSLTHHITRGSFSFSVSLHCIITVCFVPHYNVIIINPTSDYSLLPSFQDPGNTSVHRRYDDKLGGSILPSYQGTPPIAGASAGL